MMPGDETGQVPCEKLVIGGEHPISVESLEMTKTSNTEAKNEKVPEPVNEKGQANDAPKTNEIIGDGAPPKKNRCWPDERANIGFPRGHG